MIMEYCHQLYCTIPVQLLYHAAKASHSSLDVQKNNQSEIKYYSEELLVELITNRRKCIQW